MSVFTFDPDPPRVSSPWMRSEDSEKSGTGGQSAITADPARSLLSEYGLTKLPPEPQEGPTEYKLHLLLRPRRAYKSTTTAISVGSNHSKAAGEGKPAKPRVVSVSSSSQGRQDRCQQLTTQLLWRLRQSSPYHASTSYQDIVVPVLPDDAAVLNATPTVGKLAPGLEESRGALYEIGVADDGSLAGIAKDELDQSIATLRWMASNLGCNIVVLRKVVVGQCEWIDETAASGILGSASEEEMVQKQELWVAEVLVRPNLTSKDTGQSARQNAAATGPDGPDDLPSMNCSPASQLRVTLTGPTTSGKSSLLGTLSTGALDDGHGKSRLNSLKHRHELASGLTSTVTQELIGYENNTIMNYSNPNIESWIGIHDFTKDGRLVLISDSAGHPRYRRTTLRGIVGWSPHWTILCLTADHSETQRGGMTPVMLAQDAFGTTISGVELAKTHLDLCLKLELPLAIVINKSDLLNKESLGRTLRPIWTDIKKAGRIPHFLQSKAKSPADLREIPPADNDAVKKALAQITESGDFLATIPIILSSTVSGDGIGLLHALLRNLPVPPPPTAHDLTGIALNPEQPSALFHIEDKFSLPALYASVSIEHADRGTVVAGHLRFGTLSVGDTLVVGPFPSGDSEDPRGLTPDAQPSPGNFGLSMSHPSSSELNRIALRNAVSASAIKGEWHNARVVSIRNLRLPVRTLTAGQVGTVGLVFSQPREDLAPAILKLRKGMVLAVPSKHMRDAGMQLQAASGLTVFFDDSNIASLAVGTGVTFYVASVRAQARILRVSGGKLFHDPRVAMAEDEDDVFGLNEGMESIEISKKQASSPTGFEVQLELLYGREWIELGSRLVILEGTQKDGAGLDGFIGRVVEIVD